MSVPWFLLVVSLSGCSGREGDTNGPAGALAFPDHFEWGVATSAFQVEGGTDNDYDRWIDAGGPPENGSACDSWNRWTEDLDLAAQLGLDRYRLSIEWSRIEPSEGTWDAVALAHYRQMLEGVRERGMEPVVTLHHYTNPLWFADDGAWDDERAPARFAAYAQYLAENLGDLVDDWNPQNEPMVYVAGLTLVGSYPGGTLNDGDRFVTVFDHYLASHATAATAIRAADTVDADGDGAPARIWGVAAISPTYPDDPEDPASVEAARVYDEAYNLAWIRALVTGEVTFDPQSGITEQRPELAGTMDVLGINYYSRAFVVPFGGTPLGGIPCSPPLVCGDRNDLAGDNGNEVYPPGIYESIVSMSRYGLPMFITENGVADATDEVRPAYLLMHLLQVQKAITDGYDVGGYLHWSLLDNYEWLSGFDMRFGLFQVDFDTYARTPRPDSVDLYRRIVAGNEISQDMIDAWDVPEIDPR